MSIENFKRHLEAKELQSYGEYSPFREMLEQSKSTLVRLNRKAYLRVNYDHRACQNGSYANSFESNGISKTSRTLNRLVSDLPNPVDTPLYASKIKRSQRNSEALLNVATECYIEGVSTREVR